MTPPSHCNQQPSTAHRCTGRPRRLGMSEWEGLGGKQVAKSEGVGGAGGTPHVAGPGQGDGGAGVCAPCPVVERLPPSLSPPPTLHGRGWAWHTTVCWAPNTHVPSTVRLDVPLSLPLPLPPPPPRPKSLRKGRTHAYTSHPLAKTTRGLSPYNPLSPSNPHPARPRQAHAHSQTYNAWQCMGAGNGTGHQKFGCVCVGEGGRRR